MAVVQTYFPPKRMDALTEKVATAKWQCPAVPQFEPIFQNWKRTFLIGLSEIQDGKNHLKTHGFFTRMKHQIPQEPDDPRVLVPAHRIGDVAPA